MQGEIQLGVGTHLGGAAVNVKEFDYFNVDLNEDLPVHK